MKRLLTILLLAALMLTACANFQPSTDGTDETTVADNTTMSEDVETTPSEDGETTAPEDVETTTPEEVETQPLTYEERYTEIVKKHGYSSIEYFENNRIGKSLISVDASANDVYVGMSLAEFQQLICFLDLTVYEPGSPFWVYWVDKDQNYVITVFDGDAENFDYIVREIKVFENVKEDVTKEEILLITPGMHLYDVIEKVGFPRYNSISGNRATSFGSARYQLVFDTDTMTLKINEPLLRQEYENMKGTTETTDSENPTNIP